MNPGVYPALVDVRTVHATCTCGLAVNFCSRNFSRNMSNDHWMYPYDYVHGLAVNFCSLNFFRNMGNDYWMYTYEYARGLAKQFGS